MHLRFSIITNKISSTLDNNIVRKINNKIKYINNAIF